MKWNVAYMFFFHKKKYRFLAKANFQPLSLFRPRLKTDITEFKNTTTIKNMHQNVSFFTHTILWRCNHSEIYLMILFFPHIKILTFIRDYLIYTF